MSDLKEMQLRLDRIEKAIETLAKPRGRAALSEEDIAAYHRVRSALWEDGTCGINETSPCVVSCRVIDRVCRSTPIPRPCDYECTCGPCNVYTDFEAMYGGAGRFGKFGR